MSEIVETYPDLRTLHEEGYHGLAALASDVGLPLEVFAFIDHHAALVTQLDYEEGRADPLVKRTRTWSDVVVKALKRRAKGEPFVCHSIAVHPNGTREDLPHGWVEAHEV